MRFVFVHGGFHAAWCWDRTIAELESLGHQGVAVDLPGHGARVDEESTLANRDRPSSTCCNPGTCWWGIPAADSTRRWPPTRRPDLVGHIVYLAAALPREGRTYPEAMAMRDTRGRRIRRPTPAKCCPI